MARRSLAGLRWPLAGCGCGLLIGLSVPPFGWWPLAWLGFAGAALALVGRSMSIRTAIGFGVGIGQYVLGLWWVHEFSIPGCVTLMVLSALFMAAAFALVPAGRRRGVSLGLPTLVLLSDWARDRFPLGGFPLGGISLGQATSPLAPSLRLGGSLLLTGVTVVAGVAAAEALLAVKSWWVLRSPWSSGPAARRDAWRTTAVAAGAGALVVVVVAAGRLGPSGAGGHLSNLRVALVQGGGRRGTRAIYTDPQVVFARHLGASGGLQPPLDLVVWPEGVLQSHVPFTTTGDAQEVANLARRVGATVLVGVEQDVGTRNYLNEVVAWAPDGTIVDSYIKNHLVPFGEYIPDRRLVDRFFDVKDVPFDAVSGHGPGVIATPAGRIGLMISYEVFFDGRARGAVRAGGQVLVVPTNTASYRSTQVPTQEVAAARLRAWETGRWTLQVTPTGYTAVISPTGGIKEESRLDAQQVIYASVPRFTGRTWYVSLGDSPVALAALILAGLAWILGRTERHTHYDHWSRRS